MKIRKNIIEKRSIEYKIKRKYISVLGAGVLGLSIGLLGFASYMINDLEKTSIEFNTQIKEGNQKLERLKQYEKGLKEKQLYEQINRPIKI